MNTYALITGAAGGIGFELAQIAAVDGYQLLLIDIDNENLKTARDKILTTSKCSVETLCIDLAQNNAAQTIIKFVEEKQLHVEFLINNAGFGNFGYFTQSSWEKDLAMLQVHMITSSELMKHFLKSMTSRKKGYVLNIASVAAFLPGPLMSTYHASKAYLLNLSQAVANEVRDEGVQVSVLCPGMTRTNFAKANGNGDPSIKFNYLEPTWVAHYGYRQMKKGRVVIIPGIWNKISSFLPRLLPGKMATSMVGKIQRKNHEKRTDNKSLKDQ